MAQPSGRVSTRTCVVCRERRDRDALLRIVRTPEGQVIFDRSGRMNGRGAYVCGDADHFAGISKSATPRSGALDTGRLRHALKINIDDSTAKQLNEAITSYRTE